MESLFKRQIAVLIPCYNEACSIVPVVLGFQGALPGATIYVYDNCSTDGTGALVQSLQGNIVVRTSPLRGKANVVKHMLKDIDADCYLMVDGDGTYFPPTSIEMVKYVLGENIDLVVANRLSHSLSEGSLSLQHYFGNVFFTKVLNSLFGGTYGDVLSGYRAFSRRFFKSLDLESGGFELEAEISIKALKGGYTIREVNSPYKSRDARSPSKLNTYKDGIRILLFLLGSFSKKLWSNSGKSDKFT